MVDNYKIIVPTLSNIEAIRLFAVLKMDDITDRWSLIVGSNNTEATDSLFKNVVDILTKDLPHELENIARIGIFKDTDHLITDLANYSVDEDIENTKANGNFVHHGYILINKDSKSPNAQNP